MEEDAVQLNLQLQAIRTTVDGGWRITFDCDSSQSQEIMNLSQYRDQLLTVAILPHPEES